MTLAKTVRQHANILITQYKKLYEKRFGYSIPGFNRYALNHGFSALWEDYEEKAADIVEFYVNRYENVNTTYFIFHYGEVAEALDEYVQDEADREVLRRKTEERIKQRWQRQQQKRSNQS